MNTKEIVNSNTSAPTSSTTDLDEFLNNALVIDTSKIDGNIKSLLEKYELAKQKFTDSSRKDRDLKTFLKVTDSLIADFIPRYLSIVKILIGYDENLSKKTDVELDQFNKTLTSLKKRVQEEKNSR